MLVTVDPATALLAACNTIQRNLDHFSFDCAVLRKWRPESCDCGRSEVLRLLAGHQVDTFRLPPDIATKLKLILQEKNCPLPEKNQN